MMDSSKWFYFAGGLYAKSIEDLEQILHHLSDAEFTFHVNGAKNDFANWVEGVFDEKELASDLRRVLERKDTHTILQKFVKQKSHEHEVPKHTTREGHPFANPEIIRAHKNEQTEESFAHNAYDLKEIETKEVLQIPEFDKKLTQKDFEHAEDIKIDSESEELNDDELKDLADDANHELEIEGRLVLQNKRIEELNKAHAQIDVDKKLIVKEFIYGFLMGLVFGFILLGVLMQVNICY